MMLCSSVHVCLYFNSCTAPATELDGGIEDAIQCSHDHTKALYDVFDGNLKELWEGYGIIGDIVVCFYFMTIISFLKIIY